MNCIVDRGNTKTKIYFFQEDELISSYAALNTEEDQLIAFLNKHSFERGICSSSSDLPEFIKQDKFLILNNTTPTPIQLNYSTPTTLGTDRIALAVGAHFLFPKNNCLIISTGTCITIDLLDENGYFQGGIINSCFNLKFKSLHTFTENLPLLSMNTQKDFPLVGKSTEESMESGIYNGAIAEIEQTITRFKENYKDLTAIITGGDHKLFVLHLKNKIFAQQNLQAIGLNRILLHNAM